jgi:hypothetical protein
MAKPFNSVKHGLALLDFFRFGKYNGCRVDSIVSQFPDYILFTAKEFGTVYDKSVLDECVHAKTKLAWQIEETKKENAIKFHATWSAASVFDDPSILDEDVPF